MIHPDRPEEARRPRSGTGAIALAFVVVLVGGIMLVALTSPDPEAIQATTSTFTTSTSTTSTTLEELESPIDLENFSVEQISRGEPFRWESALSVVEGFPLDLVKHQGSLHLFASDVPNFAAFDSGGLRAWRSTDGITWEGLGQVIGNEYTIGSVAWVGETLVAVADDPENLGFRVWSSVDGANWTYELVPVDGGSAVMAFYPHTVGGAGETLVVSGYNHVDARRIVREKLGEAADYPWGVDVFDNEITFNLYGPLGSTLAVVSADELGLDPAEREIVVDAFYEEQEVNADIWVRTGSQWRETPLPGAQWVDWIAPGPDGSIAAYGWGANGYRSWTTSNGVNWQPADGETIHPYLAERWGDRLVALNPSGGLTISISEDGNEWEDIGPIDWFPGAIQWSHGPVAAGPGGVAMTISGWDEANLRPSPSTVAPPSVKGDEGTLTIDFESSEYRLETSTETWTWRMGTVDGVRADLETGLLQFLDSETGEVVGEFPIEDIFDAERSYLLDREPEPVVMAYDAFAFTSDGSDWTIQPMVEHESGNMFQHLAVTDTHVVATGWPGRGFFDPSAPPGFKVWTAEIP